VVKPVFDPGQFARTIGDQIVGAPECDLIP
jgi:hypothetical protein